METIKSLFDFKFDKILTAKVLRILYAIVAVFSALGAVGFVISGINDSNAALVIFGPLGSIVYLMIFRIIFESLIIKFQMAQDIRDIKNKCCNWDTMSYYYKNKIKNDPIISLKIVSMVIQKPQF